MAAMLRGGGPVSPVWGAMLLLMAVVTGCQGFACNVCLPAVLGTQAEQNLAMQLRANITRTWPDIPEAEMGECSEMDGTAKFMLECPTDNAFTACSKEWPESEMWYALSCGTISKTHGIGCMTTSTGGSYCMCASALCNSPASYTAPLNSVTAMLAALVTALVAAQVLSL